MALRLPHISGGQVHWLQGRGYTPIFSGVTALTIEFSYKVNTPAGAGEQFNILAMLANGFGFYHLGNAIITTCSAAGGGGISSALQDGFWHDIAMTVQTAGGYLKTYLDGNLIDQQLFAIAGVPLATTGVDPNGLFFLGPNFAADGDPYTADFSLTRFNGCVGLAMSEAQLSNIAQGLNVFTDYATVPANRFRFDFTQQLPGSPTVVNGPVGGGGDSGLYDLDGTTAGFWVTHGAPVWNNDTYSYTNPCVLDAPLIPYSGCSIEFTARDASGNPLALTYVESQPITSPGISINGGTVFYMTHDGTSTGRRLNIIDGADLLAASNWSMRHKVVPTDVVTVTVPAGLFRGANGAHNVATTITAVNHTGIYRENYDGIVNSNHSRIGVCGAGQSDQTCEMYWNNILLNFGTWHEYGGNGQARFTFDSVGNVTGITGSTGSGLPRISGGLFSYGLVGGTYTLLYTAGAPFMCVSGSAGEGGVGVTLLDGPTTVGGITRKRYTVTQGTGIDVQATTLPTGAIQLLGPSGVGVDGYSSKQFIMPEVVDHYGYGNCNIHRTVIAVNNSSADFSYCSPDGWFIGWNGVIVSNPVTSMTQVFGGSIPLFFTNVGVSCYHCVCSAPHGLVSGQMLMWYGTGGTPGAGGVDGPNDDMIYVDSPTTFYANWQVVATPNPTFSATYVCKVKPSYGGNPADINSVTNGMLAIDRLIEQCNACDNDLWFTFPMTWGDASVTAFVTQVATGLNPGLKLYGEYGNEVWNSGSTVYQHAVRMGYQAGYVGSNTGANWNGLRSAQVGYVGRAAWVAAGRDAADYVRVIAWQSVAASVCANECIAPANAYWTAQGYPGKPFDAVAMAPYSGGETVGNGVVTGNQRLADWFLATPFGTDLDPEELIDVLELSIEGPYTYDAFEDFYNLISVPEGIPIICYEGGYDPSPNDQTVESGMPIHNYAGGNARMQVLYGAAQQHKRMGNTYIRTMNIAGQFGCTLFVVLGSTGFQIQKYGNEGQRWVMYQTDGHDYTTWGDGSANTDLFVTSANLLGGPPDAPNAYALAKIAQTPIEPEPTTTGGGVVVENVFYGFPAMGGPIFIHGIPKHVSPPISRSILTSPFVLPPPPIAPTIEAWERLRFRPPWAFASWFSTLVYEEEIDPFGIDASQTTPVSVYTQVMPSPYVSPPPLNYIVARPPILEATWPVYS